MLRCDETINHIIMKFIKLTQKQCKNQAQLNRYRHSLGSKLTERQYMILDFERPHQKKKSVTCVTFGYFKRSSLLAESFTLSFESYLKCISKSSFFVTCKHWEILWQRDASLYYWRTHSKVLCWFCVDVMEKTAEQSKLRLNYLVFTVQAWRVRCYR